MTIITGNCLDVMKTFPDNHFSAIVTDPPYGISFMGKGWDRNVPSLEYWQEMLRIIKPGGFLLAMGGTRTFHRLTCAIEDAGFEIRDCLMYLYGSGFPKSHNHFGIEGFGTALKPAWEPIIMAMKPCDGTFKQNAEKWGQAGINIDGCRIGIERHSYIPRLTKNKNFNDDGWNKIGGCAEKKEVVGRCPANLILSEEAAALLDDQSGILKSGSLLPHHVMKNNIEGWGMDSMKGKNYPSTSGGASRFFYCAKASSSERNEGLEELPLREAEFTCRLGNDPSKGKHNSPKQNSHPTVKPIKLMEYLIKLVMPPSNGLLLDPFAGSGSTIVAANRLGFEAIGIEMNEEYANIARARVSHAKQKPNQMELFA